MGPLDVLAATGTCRIDPKRRRCPGDRRALQCETIEEALHLAAGRPDQHTQLVDDAAIDDPKCCWCLGHVIGESPSRHGALRMAAGRLCQWPRRDQGWAEGGTSFVRLHICQPRSTRRNSTRGSRRATAATAEDVVGTCPRAGALAGGSAERHHKASSPRSVACCRKR